MLYHPVPLQETPPAFLLCRDRGFRCGVFVPGRGHCRLCTRRQSAVHDQTDAVRVAERLPDGVAEEDEIARLDVLLRERIRHGEDEFIAVERDRDNARDPLLHSVFGDDSVGFFEYFLPL